APNRSPMSPMSGPSPATWAHAIRTGGWSRPTAASNRSRARRWRAGAVGLILCGALPASTPADAKRGGAPTPRDTTTSQYVPLKWSDIPGWADDDQLAAFQTFLASCRPIVAQRNPPQDARALGLSLQEPCHAARAAKVEDSVHARA